MTERTSASDSVEVFARLSAELDDPFVDRAGSLRAAGLDETQFARVEERWTARFLEAGGDTLSEQFGKAYAHKAPTKATPSRAEAPGAAAPIGPPPLAAPPVVSGPEPRTPVAAELPSFMRKPAPPVPSLPPSVSAPHGETPARIEPPRRGAARPVADVTLDAIPVARRPLLPFRVEATANPSPASTPAQIAVFPGSLSLEDYAALCAELSLHPEKRAALFARHGLSDKAGIATLADWQEVLRRDSALARTWQDLFASRVAELRSGGAGA